MAGALRLGRNVPLRRLAPRLWKPPVSLCGFQGLPFALLSCSWVSLLEDQLEISVYFSRFGLVGLFESVDWCLRSVLETFGH